MFFKGDRVLYRNTHFGTVHADQTSTQSETVQVTLDKPYGSVGQAIRIDDLEKVRDAAHEQELSLQINRIAPSREEWESSDAEPEKVTVELTPYEVFIVRKALKGFAKNTAKDQGLAATSFTRGLLDSSQEQTANSLLKRLEDL